MQTIGRNDLVFPVHYVGVEGMGQDETVFGDDLAALRRSQWIDFRPLFYSDMKSPEVDPLSHFAIVPQVVQPVWKPLPGFSQTAELL